LDWRVSRWAEGITYVRADALDYMLGKGSPDAQVLGGGLLCVIIEKTCSLL
jgi:hypothetical protein